MMRALTFLALLWAAPAAEPVARSGPAPTYRPDAVTPIASNFDTASLIAPGYERNGSRVPPSGKPDVVGAFRFICTAGQVSWDDPILYPGVKGGSPHAHLWYGNTGGDHASSYASLRTSGESTCSNKVNRSAYWVPLLRNATGKGVVPDYLSIYYKRRPKDDPECRRMAADGCVDLPNGLRVVSGWDMRRMGEEQPENKTFHHRCASPGKSSEHRATLTEAIADCGGEGQVITAINFGQCWDGRLDSPDHRSHLASPVYGNWGYLRCPATHPKIIPQLTQQIAHTIKASDGEVYYSSDRMGDMHMKPGSTFHADYMEAWDPPTLAKWQHECLDKLLTCSDGELGDGTMLKRGPLTYAAGTRLVDVPARGA